MTVNAWTEDAGSWPKSDSMLILTEDNMAYVGSLWILQLQLCLTFEDSGVGEVFSHKHIMPLNIASSCHFSSIGQKPSFKCC